MKAHVLSLAVSCLLIGATESRARTWTDSTGRFTVEAELVDVRDGQVRLKKANDDGKPAGKKGFPRGHASAFEAPEGAWYLTSVRLHGARYGHPASKLRAPANLFGTSAVEPIAADTSGAFRGLFDVGDSV